RAPPAAALPRATPAPPVAAAASCPPPCPRRLAPPPPPRCAAPAAPAPAAAPARALQPAALAPQRLDLPVRPRLAPGRLAGTALARPAQGPRLQLVVARQRPLQRLRRLRRRPHAGQPLQDHGRLSPRRRAGATARGRGAPGLGRRLPGRAATLGAAHASPPSS